MKTRKKHQAPAARNSRHIRLDRVTWTRWRSVVSAFAGSADAGRRAKALFATLLVLLLLINGLNVANSYVGRDFMTAIEHRSMPRFVSMALTYIGVFAASTIAAVFYSFAEARLGLLWRKWLTQRLLDRYLQRETYYWLRDRADIANPDQRIADDVRTFTSSTLSLLLVLLNTTFTICAFSGVMWTISPLLFVTAVGYAALGSILTVVFGRPLIWLNYNQADREASFRAELVHLRENAESVALLRREGRMGARLRRRLSDVVTNTRRIIAVNRNLGFFTTGYNYLIQIIPVLIVAPLFIRGQAEFGVISQSSMAFAHLLGAFSLIITQFQQISGYAVVLARLSALAESTEQVVEPVVGGIEIDESGKEIEWQQLSLRSRRDDSELLRSLTLSVAPGTNVLITGPNAPARVALFRATDSLWKAGSGRVVRPPVQQILFVPERPYLPPGTLREALLLTALLGKGKEAVANDERIAEVLRAVELHDVVSHVGGFDVERDWDDVLSIADQQRISFARVLLAQPRFVLLEGPATLLGVDDASHLLGQLARRSITTLTFAADDALAAHHHLRLLIETDGTWKTQPIYRE